MGSMFSSPTPKVPKPPPPRQDDTAIRNLALQERMRRSRSRGRSSTILTSSEGSAGKSLLGE
jgi:hypothetical protein